MSLAKENPPQDLLVAIAVETDKPTGNLAGNYHETTMRIGTLAYNRLDPSKRSTAICGFLPVVARRRMCPGLVATALRDRAISFIVLSTFRRGGS
jgi:hypothetical protein